MKNFANVKAAEVAYCKFPICSSWLILLQQISILKLCPLFYVEEDSQYVHYWLRADSDMDRLSKKKGPVRD